MRSENTWIKLSGACVGMAGFFVVGLFNPPNNWEWVYLSGFGVAMIGYPIAEYIGGQIADFLEGDD